MAGEQEDEEELKRKSQYAKYRTGEAELRYKKKKPEDEEKEGHDRF